MNAAEATHSLFLAQTLASAVTLVRQTFPAAKANLSPWRDAPLPRQWTEEETLDLSFHFPGWSPRLQCRSLMLQLRLQDDPRHQRSPLLGVVMRGLTYDGERWRLATVGDWTPEGAHPPQLAQAKQLQQICRDLFVLFNGSAASEPAA